MLKVKTAVVSSLMLLVLSEAGARDVSVCQNPDMRRDYVTRGINVRIKREPVIPQKAPQGMKEAVSADITLLERILPEVLEFRKESIELFEKLNAKVDENLPLSANDTKAVYLASTKRLEIRDRLHNILDKYRCTLFKYNYNSYEKYPRAWAFKLASLVLAARSIMDDNFALASMLFQKQGDLRRLLNESNSSYKLPEDLLKDEARQYYSFLNMEDKEWTVSIYQLARRVFAKYYKDNPGKDRDKEFDVISTVIESSVAYKNRKNLSYGERILDDLDRVGKRLFSQNKKLPDFFHGLAYGFVGYAVAAFGKTIGQIQWKKGILYGDKQVAAELKDLLQPGDVFWDKTRNKMSGRLIPGFWNHNAIWLGNEEQLRQLGIWDHELVRPYHANIKAGKSIAEALSPGVVMNTVEHFLNIDDIAVGRRNSMTQEELIQTILTTFGHIGKSYDFIFHTNSEEAIICSELIMLAYPDVPFDQEKLLGKWSNTPVLTARQTLENGAFDIIYFIYNGKKVPGDYIRHMKNLLDHEKTEF